MKAEVVAITEQIKIKSEATRSGSGGSSGLMTSHIEALSGI